MDEPSGNSEVRVTGAVGTGDAERDEFESAFPDLTSEVPYDAVSVGILFSSASLGWRAGLVAIWRCPEIRLKLTSIIMPSSINL